MPLFQKLLVAYVIAVNRRQALSVGWHYTDVAHIDLLCLLWTTETCPKVMVKKFNRLYFRVMDGWGEYIQEVLHSFIVCSLYGRGCVGVVRGAGRCGSVACGVAQRAQPGAFRFVFTFLYFRCCFGVF